jgi:hypothetical protein
MTSLSLLNLEIGIETVMKWVNVVIVVVVLRDNSIQATGDDWSRG